MLLAAIAALCLAHIAAAQELNATQASAVSELIDQSYVHVHPLHAQGVIKSQWSGALCCDRGGFELQDGIRTPRMPATSRRVPLEGI
jgi:hypothetical protein